jgi:hypothetical protein
MPTGNVTPLIPRARRTPRVSVPLAGDLHERLVWAAYAHGYAELDDFVLAVWQGPGDLTARSSADLTAATAAPGRAPSGVTARRPPVRLI